MQRTGGHKMIKFNVNDKILSNISRIVEKRAKGEINLTLVLDENLGEYNGKYENGVITGGSYHSILELCGRYLRNPKMKNTEFHSHKEACGIYLASHRNNYYVEAPLSELYDYVEDLALWGMNLIQMWFSICEHDSIEDGRELIDRIKSILKHCKSIGVKTILATIVNGAFKNNSPEHLRADWTSGHDGYIYNLNAHYHIELCPSTEEGMAKIIENRKIFLEEFKDVSPDYISLGAYDQGGCSCSKCAPWGGNGYVKCCEETLKLVKEYLPNTKCILSTWQFGTFTGNDDEFIGLKKAIENGPLKECVYIRSEPQYQFYPFHEGMPLPLVGFSEISMCSTLPWGGYGTNPIPRLLQILWDKDGDKLEGGLPYSEGIFEDINKVIMLRFYRENKSASDTVREYLSYEFGLSGEMLDKVHKAIMDMEDTFYRSCESGHSYPLRKPPYVPAEYDVKADTKIMPEIEKVIVEVHNTLPKEIQENKKWQLIYLRAMIDGELSRNNMTRNDKVQEYFKTIEKMFYLEKAGRCVHPDVIEADIYGKDLTPEQFQILAAGGTLD